MKKYLQFVVVLFFENYTNSKKETKTEAPFLTSNQGLLFWFYMAAKIINKGADKVGTITLEVAICG